MARGKGLLYAHTQNPCGSWECACPLSTGVLYKQEEPSKSSKLQVPREAISGEQHRKTACLYLQPPHGREGLLPSTGTQPSGLLPSTHTKRSLIFACTSGPMTCSYGCVRRTKAWTEPGPEDESAPAVVLLRGERLRHPGRFCVHVSKHMLASAHTSQPTPRGKSHTSSPSHRGWRRRFPTAALLLHLKRVGRWSILQT